MGGARGSGDGGRLLTVMVENVERSDLGEPVAYLGAEQEECARLVGGLPLHLLGVLPEPAVRDH